MDRSRGPLTQHKAPVDRKKLGALLAALITFLGAIYAIFFHEGEEPAASQPADVHRNVGEQGEIQLAFHSFTSVSMNRGERDETRGSFTTVSLDTPKRSVTSETFPSLTSVSLDSRIPSVTGETIRASRGVSLRPRESGETSETRFARWENERVVRAQLGLSCIPPEQAHLAYEPLVAVPYGRFEITFLKGYLNGEDWNADKLGVINPEGR